MKTIILEGIDYIMLLLIIVFVYWLLQTPAYVKYVYIPDMSNAFVFPIPDIPIEQQGAYILEKKWKSMKYKTDRR